jgi:hypothetical protein
MQNPGERTPTFYLGLARARDPDATTVRVLLVARDLGTHDREWSFFVVDRTASVTSRPHLDWLVILD